MGAGKTFGTWLSGSLEDAANKRIASDFGGNDSKYIKHLIEKDLNETLDTTAPNALVVFAKKLQPTLVSQIESSLATRKAAGHEVDQPRLFARMVEALADALTRKDFVPEAPFRIFGSADELRVLLEQTDQGRYLIDKLRSYALFEGPRDLSVNERPMPADPTPENAALRKLPRKSDKANPAPGR